MNITNWRELHSWHLRELECKMWAALPTGQRADLTTAACVCSPEPACSEKPHLNMMGLSHSRRSPLGRRIPKVRV